MVAEAGVVELSVVIAATPEQVWRAITTPELSARWMGTFKMVSSWEVGATLAIVGRLGERDHTETGTVLACQPPALLRYEHWSRLWRVPDRPENRAVMTIDLAAEAEATRVSVRHDLPRVEAIVPHSRFYWTVTLEQLRKLLEQG